MTTRAPTAPAHTTTREWRIAMMAAMKNVRSPISVARMMPNASPNACVNCFKKPAECALAPSVSAPACSA
eukprot:CAMPEP_0184402406 /NCGR_PEP_ID=MMETSP0007-20130409/82795_1 /TAXON_ID=97485 /ORGANISM="Prymnesium parvum, Strain Texoma1" /LENGTH=69 /DNA_ID=CAMNT_0026758175 /DNA_START=70 /DNA_END=276 /DNA_ORIENTATION=-